MKVLKRILVTFLIFIVLWVITLIVPSLFIQGEIPQYVYSILLVVALLFTFGGLLASDYNKIQKVKATIPGLRKDVEALKERRNHQLDQANRVLDKYLAHEKSVQESVASSHIKSGADFQVSVQEKYPELMANEAVASLMSQINKLEEQLVIKEQQLNASTTEYNASIHCFPIVLIRKLAKLEDVDQESAIDTVLGEEISDEDLGI